MSPWAGSTGLLWNFLMPHAKYRTANGHENAPAKATRRRRSRIRRFLSGLLVFFALASIFVTVQMWVPLGKRPSGERLARMKRSPNWGAGEFNNPIPMRMSLWNAFTTAIFDNPEHVTPKTTLDTHRVNPRIFESPPRTGLRVTWLGHSTLLIELDGKRFLTDPVWGERASPHPWIGPKRWYPPVLALDNVPPVDAVLISHDHYDHLDYPTIKRIKSWDTIFVVPLGVGSHLEYWGVPASKIAALDWWDSRAFGDVTITCTPARHFSGRGVFDRGETLWCGYALVGPRRRAYFSGDTSMFPGLATIGKRLGPFDITMLDAGAYSTAWADVHMGPEQAVIAHQMLRGKVYMPVHWALFNLAPHGWTAPVERSLVAAEEAHVRIVTPRPGESLEPTHPPPVRRWWPQVPWKNARERPIESSK